MQRAGHEEVQMKLEERQDGRPLMHILKRETGSPARVQPSVKLSRSFPRLTLSLCPSPFMHRRSELFGIYSS